MGQGRTHQSGSYQDAGDACCCSSRIRCLAWSPMTCMISDVLGTKGAIMDKLMLVEGSSNSYGDRTAIEFSLCDVYVRCSWIVSEVCSKVDAFLRHPVRKFHGNLAKVPVRICSSGVLQDFQWRTFRHWLERKFGLRGLRPGACS